MFGWFTPRCPLDTYEKTWTEMRLGWLAGRLGVERMTSAEVILPNQQHFPDPYHGTDLEARRIMDRLCGLMGLDPQTIDFIVTPDQGMPDAAGLYHRKSPQENSLIRLAESQLNDPMALVATLAHELAHEILLGGGLLDESVPDHEWVTDLLPVFLGLGIFAANATIREQSYQEGQMSYWMIGRQGYLPSRVFGYAMALFVWARGETAPAWARYLRRDASAALSQGLKYLVKTGDCLFRPETLHTFSRALTPTEYANQIRKGTPTFRLAALWAIEEHQLTTPDCLAAVIGCLEDPDPVVASEAALILPHFGNAAETAIPILVRCLHNDSDGIRASSVQSLGHLGLQNETIHSHLIEMLSDPSRKVLGACGLALAQLEKSLDERATNQLLARFEEVLIDCDSTTVDILAATLVARTDDPEKSVRVYFKDKELRKFALETLSDCRSAEPDKRGGG